MEAEEGRADGAAGSDDGGAGIGGAPHAGAKRGRADDEADPRAAATAAGGGAPVVARARKARRPPRNELRSLSTAHLPCLLG